MRAKPQGLPNALSAASNAKCGSWRLGPATGQTAARASNSSLMRPAILARTWKPAVIGESSLGSILGDDGVDFVLGGKETYF